MDCSVLLITKLPVVNILIQFNFRYAWNAYRLNLNDEYHSCAKSSTQNWAQGYTINLVPIV